AGVGDGRDDGASGEPAAFVATTEAGVSGWFAQGGHRRIGPVAARLPGHLLVWPARGLQILQRAALTPEPCVDEAGTHGADHSLASEVHTGGGCTPLDVDMCAARRDLDRHPFVAIDL